MGDLSQHFSSSEFRCHCRKCQMPAIAPELLQALEQLISDMTVPATGRVTVHITSGYRCPDHNRKVGGAPNSQHCQGIAADIVVKTPSGNIIPPISVYSYFDHLFPNSHGLGLYKGWTHIDTRPNRARWKG